MIRHATLADVPVCLDMGRAFFAATGVTEFPFDDESGLATLRHLVESDDGALLVAEHEGELIGMAGALSYPHYMNHAARAAQELFWWVAPEFRGCTAGVRLLQALEVWAKDKGCATLTMICLPIDSPAEGIYARTGYRPVERSYIKGL